MLSQRLPDRDPLNRLVEVFGPKTVEVMISRDEWKRLDPADRYILHVACCRRRSDLTDVGSLYYKRHDWAEVLRLLNLVADDPLFASFQAWMQFDPIDDDPIDPPAGHRLGGGLCRIIPDFPPPPLGADRSGA